MVQRILTAAARCETFRHHKVGIPTYHPSCVFRHILGGHAVCHWYAESANRTHRMILTADQWTSAIWTARGFPGECASVHQTIEGLRTFAALLVCTTPTYVTSSLEANHPTTFRAKPVTVDLVITDYAIQDQTPFIAQIRSLNIIIAHIILKIKYYGAYIVAMKLKTEIGRPGVSRGLQALN